MKILTTFFVLVLLAASCKPKDPFEDIGKELCTCMRPMAELQSKFQSLMEQGKQDELMALISESQKIETDMSACGLAIETKFGRETLEKNEEKVTEAMRKACPDIVEMMNAPAEDEMMMPDSTMEMEQGK